jgi:hypothetical protein
MVKIASCSCLTGILSGTAGLQVYGQNSLYGGIPEKLHCQLLLESVCILVDSR